MVQDPRHHRVGGRRHQRQIEDAGKRARHRDDARAGMAVDHRAAGEIADGERAQHHRDQPRPGADAAAEIGEEIAAAEHLEAHQHAPTKKALAKIGAAVRAGA